MIRGIPEVLRMISQPRTQHRNYSPEQRGVWLKIESKDLNVPNLAVVRPDLEIPPPRSLGSRVWTGMETDLRFLLKFRSCPSVLLLSTLGRKPLSDGNRAIGR
jgi:hypothetical protein